MIPLEELSKINNLIANCNDMIDGKFILADYKIIAILKDINESECVYELMSNCMTNFNFEREFSQSCLRNSPNKKIALPQEPEKILAFVFCILINIKNKTFDFDKFLKEYYSSPEGRSAEYKKFAQDLILPFRNIIANYFDIPIQQAENITLNPSQQPMQILQEEPQQEIEEQQEEIHEMEEIEQDNFQEAKINQFFAEVKSICQDILLELDQDIKIKPQLKENIRYITNIIIEDSEVKDLQNTLALLTAFMYMTDKVKSIKFLTKELEKIMFDLYE